jgi:hypothetical protein
MARPDVADGEDGLHIRRKAADIINKHRGQPTGGDLPVWGLSRSTNSAQ